MVLLKNMCKHENQGRLETPKSECESEWRATTGVFPPGSSGPSDTVQIQWSYFKMEDEWNVTSTVQGLACPGASGTAHIRVLAEVGGDQRL